MLYAYIPLTRKATVMQVISFLILCLVDILDLRGWIWRDFNRLCVDERIVWING